MAYVAGKALVTTWTPAGGGAFTIPVQDDTEEDGGDVLDATNTSHVGEQAVMPGIVRRTKTVKFLMDTTYPFYLVAQGVRFGYKGTLTTQFGSGSTTESMPAMITKVGRARPCNGLVTIDVTLTSDAITGAFAYPSA